jgi:hypothetical protein
MLLFEIYIRANSAMASWFETHGVAALLTMRV